MKGLILKEILVIKNVFKSSLILILLYTVLGIVTNNVSFFTTFVTAIMSVFLINTFTYDEMSKWDRFAAAMPLKREQIVLSKYIIGISLIAIGSLVSLTVITINNVRFGELLFNGASLIYVVSGIMLLTQAIYIPIIYKFGSTKGRIMIFIIIFIPIVLMSILIAIKPSGLTLSDILPSSPPIGVFNIIFAVGLICFIVSYFLSVKIYSKKDL